MAVIFPVIELRGEKLRHVQSVTSKKRPLFMINSITKEKEKFWQINLCGIEKLRPQKTVLLNASGRRPNFVILNVSLTFDSLQNISFFKIPSSAITELFQGKKLNF